MIKSIQAWFIHKQWSGDTSVRPCFFTSELGLLHCLYKGGRTPKKQGSLQPFTSLWIHLEERHSQYFVQSVEIEAPSLDLSGTSLFSALYLNELIYYLLKPLAAEPELFQAYAYTLHHLALEQKQETIEALLRRFEWTLLKTCGHSFSLTEDTRGMPIKYEGYYQFIPGQGMHASAKGFPGKHLLALSSDDLGQSDYRKSAKILMRQAIDYVLGGREIKARSLFNPFPNS
ncbi:DNA repair protein RecO [Legionella sp. km772]|uniref:DNA repair protein RecO n=1 Tax=Legionella sp. km772 TaxID=2498111 RepID=UPI000F8D737A|nr:DNA repair protein RecO C-terminal domain-containing protein [Legionella sp. km772]RUR06521.1 DNA repair protein RecO [Legionella sp. km772]